MKPNNAENDAPESGFSANSTAVKHFTRVQPETAKSLERVDEFGLGQSSVEPPRGLSSAVERAVHIGEVVGSNPSVPTILLCFSNRFCYKVAGRQGACNTLGGPNQSNLSRGRNG